MVSKGSRAGRVLVVEASVAAMGDRDGAVASALSRAAVDLRAQGRLEDCVAVVDELVARLGDLPADSPYASAFAEGLWQRGLAFWSMGSYDLSLQAYDDLIERFASARAADLAGLAAHAMLQKAFNLERMDRTDEALVVYKQTVELFDAAPSPLANAWASWSRISAATLLRRTRSRAALERGFREAAGVQDLALAARALVAEADEMLDEGQPREALEIACNVLEAVETGEELPLRKVASLALATKWVALTRTDDLENMQPFQEMVARYGDVALDAFSDEEEWVKRGRTPARRRRFASLVLTRAMILDGLEREEQYVRALEFLVDEFAGDAIPEVEAAVAFARNRLAHNDED
jgi:tetratricopeptide (TPR) repeat protein